MNAHAAARPSPLHSPLSLFADPLLRSCPGTDRACREVMTACRTMLAAKIDNLKMKQIPGFRREKRLQIPLRTLDILASRKPPTRSQTVNMRVDRKCGVVRMLAPSRLRRSCARLQATPPGPGNSRAHRLRVLPARSSTARESHAPWRGPAHKSEYSNGSASPSVPAIFWGVAARANRSGVTLLTRSSVHWAESKTATRSVYGSS